MFESRNRGSTEAVFEWEGKDRSGKWVLGEIRAVGENQVRATLLRQGVKVHKLKKRRTLSWHRIRPGDIAIFTRQLATLMKAGVPLLQSFDIVGRGNPNPGLTDLLHRVRSDMANGSSLSAAFRQHPRQFSALYCNLVEAGEAAGILDDLLERLATYLEKSEALKSKVKSVLMYPAAVIAIAGAVVALMMIFVIPAFQEVFASMGVDLPGPTLLVIALSGFLRTWWWLLLGTLAGAGWLFFQTWRRSLTLQRLMDRLLLRLPIFGRVVNKAAVARWSRTLSTMLAAGVPLVDALDSVGGAAGNSLYADATKAIQRDVATGTSLFLAMNQSRRFPPMVLQMVAIGEESGALDQMLAKAADFYEREVDDLVAGLSSLMEPIIIVVLGSVIGGIVVAMFLPIFQLGQVL